MNAWMAGRSAPGASFPVESLRRQFPALQRHASFVFFDNAAGAQIPAMALAAVEHHLVDHNVQRGGRYRQSIAVDESIARARATVAAFVNARRPEEIAFGMNATSFIRTISLAIGQTLAERNEIVLTDLDHEANIATWLVLERMGARFRWWKIREDGRLHTEDLLPLLSARTRLVACTLTSNALGTVVDARAAAKHAHAAGADIFLDSVHYAPHAPLDVQDLDCDFLVCSGYKIFAPHMGFLWSRYERVLALPTFREDFIPDLPPGKLEAGTFIYENVAGMQAAVRYLAAIGRTAAGKTAAPGDATPAEAAELGNTTPGRNAAPMENSTPREDATLREDARQAMQAIRVYEAGLSRELARVLRESGAQIYGIDDDARLDQRVPTFCFNLPGVLPKTVTEEAARADIAIRDGHMYSPRLMRRLGLAPETGVVRVSLVHYNTIDEIHRLADVLAGLRKRPSRRS